MLSTSSPYATSRDDPPEPNELASIFGPLSQEVLLNYVRRIASVTLGTPAGTFSSNDAKVLSALHKFINETTCAALYIQKLKNGSPSTLR